MNPASPYKSVDDLMKALKDRPGKLNNGNPGPSSVPGLAAELFRIQSGLSFTSVAYKGSAPALAALMSGEVDFAFSEMGTALGLMSAGKLRALTVLQTGRLTTFPDVPSIDETSAPKLHASAWQGVLTPKGTPAPVIARLSKAISTIIASPDMTTKLKTFGGTSLATQPAAFTEFLGSETRRWTSIVNKLGITAN